MMKTTILIGFLIFSLNLFSQQNTNIASPENDLLARRGLAAGYLKENNYDYKSGHAKAIHNILMEAFCKNGVVIFLDYKNVPNEDDKQNIISFVEGLNSILIITPTWEELVTLEKNKVLAEDRYSRRQPVLIENKK